MKCMNCGAELNDSAYCPKCGCDVSVQKQAIVLSGLYYNQGLEKAQVRDLSGAIDMLRRSLKFNKLNVPARNLLGLVYFEMGEVVAALSEWVISKNIQPENNIAAEYIENLQQDANRLDIINQTIKKYNIALENCHKGNEDVAMIQLKKILAQNPKLIKGYHLLSLLYIRQGEYEKARKQLRKAIRIDKTNTTTLRFLKEIDEQTGTSTSFEPRFSIWSSRDNDGNRDENAALDASAKPAQPAFRETTAGSTIFNIAIGLLIGALAVWFLIMPARTQRITQEADRKTSEYSSRAAEADARITELSQQMEISEETVNTANTQIETATAKTTAYESLIKAVNAYNNGDLDLASNALSSVDVSKLTAEGKAIYDDLVEKANGELLRGYKTEGISAYEEEDYQTAIECLEAAKAIDSSDYEVLSYLAHSYRMTGDTANADINFQLIINTYPDTVRADNARVYMSEEALAAAENGGGNQTENSDGGENEEEPTEGEGSGDGEDDYEEEYEEDYEG